MESEWPLVTVDELTSKIAMGPFGSNIKVSTFVPSGIPVISGEHLRGTKMQDGRFNFITNEHAEKLKNSLVIRGDVIFTHAGNIGQVAVIPEMSRYQKYIVSQRQFFARCKRDRILPEYLAYYFHSPDGHHKLLSNASQVGVPSIARPSSHLKSIEVPLPPLNHQRNVCDVMVALEMRIEHNRALATNLEAIARRLFKSWFVDFDPVRAKAAGEKPIGLADDIAALFPDRFVESELGEIPEEWKVGKVSDFCTNIRVGCTPSQFSSDDFYVGLEHFDRHCLTLWNGGSGDDATSNKSRFEKYDLLFGKLRPYFHKVAIAPMNGICSTDILVIRCADMAYREFMYFTLFQDDIIQFVSDASGGTRMPRTNWETLANYDCAIPPETVSTAFGEITTPMIEIMMQCVSENDALAKLRDLLLPRLISGKLRVEDAESIIEEAIA
ncbi:Restriction endonuclease S subunit [mine drainage metagenome]|jgi:type I restriction enzyme S subunit|uniref:Restriction endonuclease S subunit n=1 Tax=mine drainage metagenome TaxID=410659 RepID=A0A3P3ZS24_9ZZZZ